AEREAPALAVAEEAAELGPERGDSDDALEWNSCHRPNLHPVRGTNKIHQPLTNGGHGDRRRGNVEGRGGGTSEETRIDDRFDSGHRSDGRRDGGSSRNGAEQHGPADPER